MEDENSVLSRPLAVCLIALLCNLLWGSAFPCVKTGYALFEITDTASRILFAGCRFALAGVLAVVFGSLVTMLSERRGASPGKTAGKRSARSYFLKPKPSSWFLILKLACVQTVLQYVLFYTGLAYASGVRSSIINGSGNLLAILGAGLLLKTERLSGKKLLGCAIGFAGVILVNLGGAASQGLLVGEIAVFGSSVAYAASSMMLKIYSEKENAVVLSGYQFIIGGSAMIAAGLAAGGRLHVTAPVSLLLLLYMALISSVAYTLWGILLKYNPVGKVAIYGFSNPVFGSILSAIILGEGSQLLGGRALLSLGLVSVGIYLVNKAK